MSSDPLYKVIFANQDQIFEIYARSVGEGALFGFIEIEELVFGDENSMLVDPSTEKLKSEFADVRRSYVPMHSIIRIDEVDKRGELKVTDIDSSNSKVTPFPVYTPKS